MKTIKGYCHITDAYCAVNGQVILRKSPDSEYGWFRQLYNFARIQYPKFHKMDAMAQAGVLGVELMRIIGELPMEYQEEGVDLIFANRLSSTRTDQRFQESYANHTSPSPALFVYTLPNIVLGEIAILKKWYGENIFVVMPEFNSDFFERFVQRHLDRGSEAVIGGWVEIVQDKTEVFLFLAEANALQPNWGPMDADNLLEKYQQQFSSTLK